VEVGGLVWWEEADGGDAVAVHGLHPQGAPVEGDLAPGGGEPPEAGHDQPAERLDQMVEVRVDPQASALLEVGQVSQPVQQQRPVRRRALIAGGFAAKGRFLLAPMNVRAQLSRRTGWCTRRAGAAGRWGGRRRR
jgi:hypothetical protein